MSVFFDESRKRWKYDFVSNKVRYAGICLNLENSQPLDQKRFKNEALSFELSLKKQLKDTNRIAVASDYTLAEAIEAYVLVAQNHKSFFNIKVYLKTFLCFWSPVKPVREINVTELNKFVQHLRNQKIQHYASGPNKKTIENNKIKVSNKNKSDSTIQRYLATLRAVLNLAHNTLDGSGNKRLLEFVPKSPKLDIPDHSPNSFNLEQLSLLYNNSPDHLKDFILASVMTGMRMREVLRLKKDQLNPRNLSLRKGLNNKARRDSVILYDDFSFAFFNKLLNQATARNTEFLITFKKDKDGEYKPLNNVKTAFKASMKRAGLESTGLKIHNLKTTSISLAAKGGATPSALQKVGDHADIKTTQKHYLSVDDADKRAAFSGIANQLETVKLLNKPQDSTKLEPVEVIIINHPVPAND